MSKDREFEGKDLEEALHEAAETLGIAEEDLHYEMLEQGRRGLLGLGTKNVRIRVKPPIDHELPEEPAERKGRRKRGSRRSSAAAPASRQGGPVDPSVVRDVQQTVTRIVEGVGLELEVSAKPHDSGISLELRGRDQRMLTTKNAELLLAIQFLLNRMSRRAWPGVGRINVGCNGHSKPRDEELVSTVRKVAKQVARTGKTRKLQPMNAYERRLVHLTVREFSGLTSSSDGTGTLKRVRISKVKNQI